MSVVHRDTHMHHLKLLLAWQIVRIIRKLRRRERRENLAQAKALMDGWSLQRAEEVGVAVSRVLISTGLQPACMAC